VRDAEVDQLHLTGVGHDHVVRRRVAVDQLERTPVVVAQLMRVVQTRQHLGEHPQVEMQRQAVLREATEHAIERLAIEELHRHARAAAALVDRVGLDHVLMGHAGGDAGLVQEHRAVLCAVGEAGPQLLEHEQLAEVADTACDHEVHVGHAAVTDHREASVLAIGCHRGPKAATPNQAQQVTFRSLSGVGALAPGRDRSCVVVAWL